MKPATTRPLGAFVVLFLVLVGFLAATYSFRRITDTELNSFQTRALVLHGDVDLDRYPRVNRPGYFTIERGDHLFSIYGTGVSVVAAPIYAVLARTDASESFRQGAAAIPFVAASVLLMYVLLSRLVDRRLAVAGAVVFGFGTTMWPLASMAMFQHGPVAMFQLIGLIGLFSERARAPALAGLGFAAAAFIRPTTGIAFGLVGLYQLARGKRPAVLFALGSAIPVAGMLIQNRWIWGTWLTGGYSQSGVAFDADMPSALWGLTFGWWRGIFVYSPVLVIGLAGFVMALRRLQGEVERKLAVLGVAVVGTVLFYSRWSTWHNGSNQFGYRYLLDVVPFLVVLAAYAVGRSERLRTYAIPLAVVSLLTMTFGAAPNNFGLDGIRFPTRVEDTSFGQAWIVFFDEPIKGLIRLAGLAAVMAIFAALAPRRREEPILVARPA
jgi:hypothetical protein